MRENFLHLPLPKVPPEQRGNAILGSIMHLGSPVACVLLLSLVGVTLTNALLVFLGVSGFFTALTVWDEKRNASVDIPPPTTREIFEGLFMVFVKGILIGGAYVTAGWWLLSHVSPWASVSNAWWKIGLGVVGIDFCYYWIHRIMCHQTAPNPILRFYRQKHWAHHSVTQLDFLRGNQSSLADTCFIHFQPAAVLVSWLLGLDLAGAWTAYFLILALQATDHTSVTYNIGWLSWIFMDNHAHKFHHCLRGHFVNHAAAFSVFDRLFGTYYENWALSTNYLHLHRIPIPIRPRPRRPEAAQADTRTDALPA